MTRAQHAAIIDSLRAMQISTYQLFGNTLGLRVDGAQLRDTPLAELRHRAWRLAGDPFTSEDERLALREICDNARTFNTKAAVTVMYLDGVPFHYVDAP